MRNVTHIGPQKSATTWLYECLKEHEQVLVPPTDAVHYFDINYARGPQWYEQQFSGNNDADVRIDMTPSYIRPEFVANRIRNYDPDCQIIVCLRNPLERAFSHYWHEKKKKRFDYKFKEVLNNYDLFSAWVEPGMYYQRLRPFWDEFGEERVLCQWFDELNRDPVGFFKEAAEFMGLNTDVQPKTIGRRINVATAAQSQTRRNVREAAGKVLESLHLKDAVRETVGKVKNTVGHSWGYQETLAQVPRSVREDMWSIFEPDVQKLEAALAVDLSEWRRAGE